MRKRRVSSNSGLLGSWAMVAIAVCLFVFELTMVLQTHAMIERIAP